MALSRYEHTGDAPATGLASGIGSTDATFTLVSGTGYPTGAVGKFVICIDAGTSSEEKILCSARSGTTVTVATSGRGYDNTTAASHSAGSTNVTHVLAAAEIDDASDHIYTTTRDDHTQYAKADGTRAFSGAVTVSSGGLTVTAGGLTVSAGGATITGNSSVTGTWTSSGALTVSGGGATITGNSTISGTLTVTSLTQTADDAAWIAPTLVNSWINSGGGPLLAGYRKVNGRIYLRGLIQSGSLGSTAFTLPTGYRPSGLAGFAVGSETTNGVGFVKVDASGNVIPTAGAGYWYLDGISFDTLS